MKQTLDGVTLLGSINGSREIVKKCAHEFCQKVLGLHVFTTIAH